MIVARTSPREALAAPAPPPTPQASTSSKGSSVPFLVTTTTLGATAGAFYAMMQHGNMARSAIVGAAVGLAAPLALLSLSGDAHQDS